MRDGLPFYLLPRPGSALVFSLLGLTMKKAYIELAFHLLTEHHVAHDRSTCSYKTYRSSVVVEFLTQNKIIGIPTLVSWKKLASILLRVYILYSGYVE